MSAEQPRAARPVVPVPRVQFSVPRAILGYWRLFGAGIGSLAVLLGFAGIIASWVSSTGEVDIREQMQELISCVGFLGLILTGMFLLAGEVFAGMRRGLAPQLDAIANALADLAVSSPPRGPALGGTGTDVVASEGVFHRPDCALLAGLPNPARLARGLAAAAGLRPCPHCVGEEA